MASQRLAPLSARTSHEIVNANGERVGCYANKSAASRSLNKVRREWSRGWRPNVPRIDLDALDPHTFTVRPVAK